ncbi:MAG TPA: DUF3014 domain-containing protein [Rhodanobacter sp.]|jgi:hypothetical protein|nr:DUF3014 domain-containing protein [Rhodanobacter sp.]
MRRQGSTGGWIIAAVVVLVLSAAGVFLAYKIKHAEQSTPSPPVAKAPAAPSSAPTPIQHPIAQAQAGPASAATAALPTLEQSDADVTAVLERLAGNSDLSSLLVRPQLIERIVASIDALPGRSLGGFMLPARTPKGDFVTQNIGGNTVIGESNAARYAPYMQIVERVEPQALVSWYVHAYPLFQQAYRKLGYPHGYFNDRLIVVIDNLLAAPEPARAPALQRSSKGYYIYADASLEALSSGQRLLLRAGPGNEVKIKARLRAIRSLLVGQHLQPAAPSTVVRPANASTR